MRNVPAQFNQFQQQMGSPYGLPQQQYPQYQQQFGAPYFQNNSQGTNKNIPPFENNSDYKQIPRSTSSHQINRPTSSTQQQIPLTNREQITLKISPPPQDQSPQNPKQKFTYPVPQHARQKINNIQNNQFPLQQQMTNNQNPNFNQSNPYGFFNAPNKFPTQQQIMNPGQQFQNQQGYR